MKKSFESFVLGLIVSFILFPVKAYLQAPNLVKLTPPSPNSQAFQKYGDIPVSAYTGVPDISIPIYTIKFRDITVPIFLSYHASGIKVAEEASNVGLGWVLNAAGLISRNIIGTDDFISSTYFNNSAINIMDFSDGQGPTQGVLRGCYLQMFNKTIPDQPTLYNYDVTNYLKSSPAVDFQPDQYYYNFPGHSGKFIMKRNMQAILQKQDPIQITCLDANGSTWQIKSAEGFIYDFSLSETYFDNPGGTHISAWYLTKITSPMGNVVNFNYTAVSNYIQPIGSYTETRNDWVTGVPISTFAGGEPTTNTGAQSGQVPGKQYSCMVLSSIDFSIGKVVFNYSGGRTDLPNDQKLDSVSIFSQGALKPFKTVAFQYDYFYGPNDISFAKSAPIAVVAQRLKLTQVYEKGYYNGQFIQNPPYIFTYDENNSYPAKTSFARDHWGYYNGSVNKSTLIPSTLSLNVTDPFAFHLGLDGPEREPNPLTATAFSLTKLKYPSGGWTDFQYESNDFDETQSQVNDNSYFQTNNNNTSVQITANVGYDAISHLYLGTSDTLDLSNEWVSSAPGGGSPLVTVSAAFRFSGGTGNNCNDAGALPGQMYYTLKTLNGTLISQIDPYALPLCNATQSNSPCAICDPNSPVIVYSGTYQLPPGKYIWQAFVGTSGAALKLQDIHATFNWFNTVQANSIIVGGGLRIKRIIDHDGINEANNKTRHYVYHYWADKTNSGVLSEYSYGRRMSKPHYSYFNMSYDVGSVNYTSACLVTTWYAAHLMRSCDSNNPLNGSAAGAPVGYDEVTELIGENGEFGKKVYNYTNNPDHVASYTEPYSGNALPLMPPYGSALADPLNGSLTNETDYAMVAGKYVKVKDISNQYTKSASKENIVFGLTNVVLPSYQYGDKCSTVIPPQICDTNSLTLTYQCLQSEWTYLTSTDLKMYNQIGNSSQFEEALTNYYYDNPNHLQLTRTVSSNSKGEQVTSTMRYPLDFTVPNGTTDLFALGIQNLQNKHVMTAPIEKYVQKQKADGTNIGTTSYELTRFNSTLPSPGLAYVSMLTTPNTSFTATTINTSGVVMDAAYQPLISFDSYDPYGNLTQQHKVNDVYHSYIWDYNNSLPIAEVTNASLNEIAYTSFEADGTGNWTFTDPVRNTSNKLTGSQSYTITTGKTISKTGLTSTKSYIVSYWSTNGAISVNGIAATAGVTKNGWTFYQHLLPVGTTSVNITGNATIDELRLFPADAQMSTYTYVPLVGLTSTCSPNNMTQYYVYDALGRLREIVDQDGNIVKTIEYHYQGQTGFQ